MLWKHRANCIFHVSMYPVFIYLFRQHLCMSLVSKNAWVLSFFNELPHTTCSCEHQWMPSFLHTPMYLHLFFPPSLPHFLLILFLYFSTPQTSSYKPEASENVACTRGGWVSKFTVTFQQSPPFLISICGRKKTHLINHSPIDLVNYKYHNQVISFNLSAVVYVAPNTRETEAGRFPELQSKSVPYGHCS